MKLKCLIVAAVCLCCALVPAAAGAEIEKKDGVPVAQVTQSSYTFPPVVDGTEVVHDFIMKNSGTAVLKIVKIKTG